MLSGSADYNSSPAGIADGPGRSSACEHCWRRHRTMATSLVRSLRSATANPGRSPLAKRTSRAALTWGPRQPEIGRPESERQLQKGRPVISMHEDPDAVVGPHARTPA